MDIYGIEYRSTYWGSEYRYYSKYNGARGAWHCHKKDAISEGKEHAKIVESLIAPKRTKDSA